MRRADIKPGEVYAYRRSENYSLRQIRFLTPVDNDHLYTAGPRGGARYVKARSNKPRAGSGFSSTDVGWLVAVSEPSGDVSGATLKEVLAGSPSIDAGYRYQIQVTTTQVVGLYAEVKAAEDARSLAEAEEKARRTAASNLLSNTMMLLKDRLAELGVEVTRNKNWFELSIEEARKLIAKLEAK